jgi:hypothetical protein
LRATPQTFNGSNTYRYLRKPAYVGQLRMKGWAYVIPPSGAADPEWIKRAKEFWQLQAETFGLRFEDEILLSVDYGSGCVVSAVHVAEILPGRRTRDYATPRVAEKRVLDQLAQSDEPA